MKNDDKTCLDQAILAAEESFQSGNYPVGAVLTIDGVIIDIKGNTGNEHKTYVNHAELNLIFNNAAVIRQASSNNSVIELYSTLEPCIMCLGTAVMNMVQRIVYIQTDPHGGACHMNRQGMGARYVNRWPEIVQVQDYSDKPKAKIIQFLTQRLEAGDNVAWCKTMLELFKT